MGLVKGRIAGQMGLFLVKRSKRSWRVKVSAYGAGVVSHAGVGMLPEIDDLTGVTSQVSAVLADTYKGSWVHDPGRVFIDLAAAVAGGADCVSGIGSLVDQQAQHDPVARVKHGVAVDRRQRGRGPPGRRIGRPVRRKGGGLGGGCGTELPNTRNEVRAPSPRSPGTADPADRWSSPLPGTSRSPGPSLPR